MNTRFTGSMLGLMVAATAAAAFFVYPHMPDILISHWNAAGEPNGTMSRFWGVFLLPGIEVILLGVWWLLPRIDPIAPGFRGFRYVYDFIWILLTAFLSYVYALTLFANLGGEANILPRMLPALGGLFIAIGLLLPYVKRNWFFGIRTPWTLSSGEVWDRTHRFSRWLFVLAGIATVIAGFLSPMTSFWVVVGSILAAALLAVAYSYFIYVRRRGS